MLGPLITGALLSAALPWRSACFAMGALSLVLAGLCLAARRACLHLADEPAPADPHAPTTGGSIGRLAMFHAIGPFALIAGGEAAVTSLLPLYLRTERGWGEAQASFLLSLLLIGLLAGRIAASLAGRSLRSSTILAGCTLCGVGVVAAVVPGPTWLLLVGAFVLGGQFSATWPTFFDAAHQYVPRASHALALGSVVSSVIGIALCIFVSSMLAESHPQLALIFGPTVLAVAWGWYRFGPVAAAGR